MWRRTYLLLLLVRLYCALSPSYLHPDENFQGPEVIAGEIFSYPIHRTWEFTSEHPIRSVFPLWPVYGLPMLLLRWVWAGSGHGDNDIAPSVVFWTLRTLMFFLSFVLEDWAVHELVESPRHRRVAVLLVASSYVTWTYQNHTFSNSIETLVVAWCLVIIQRITKDKQRSSIFASGTLAMLIVLGIFNRITFPAFVFVPGLRMIPHFGRKPLSLVSMVLFGLFASFVAISLDTSFYTKGTLTLSTLLRNPVITPINNLLYNLNSENLALHGLHPYYQDLLVNLPLLLGPFYLLLPYRPKLSLPFGSAISGILVLSLFQRQEARFLIPSIPLLLSSIKIPQRFARIWISAWIIFNAIFGILMGIFHQGGVVPSQLYMASRDDATQALWWRTYSPPIWLLNGKNEQLTTRDLMGMKPDLMIQELEAAAQCHKAENATYLISPYSSIFLDAYTGQQSNTSALRFEQIWIYRNHLNLDDLEFGEDGIWPTLKRVLGRRGLIIWRVTKECG
ncbi:MAG: alpha 1,2 mannosyltransferase [Trizodia sp. TS-e1964]|nr:MAG: alpha 1,2 mannosyltransferase [Trizodia sp. TS-e1964]